MADFADAITTAVASEQVMQIAITDTDADNTYMEANAWIGDESECLTAYIDSLDAEAEGTEAAITAANEYTDGYAVLTKYSQAADLNNTNNIVGVCVGATVGEGDDAISAAHCWTAATAWIDGTVYIELNNYYDNSALGTSFYGEG